jgi:hypothetical protein
MGVDRRGQGGGGGLCRRRRRGRSSSGSRRTRRRCTTSSQPCRANGRCRALPARTRCATRGRGDGPPVAACCVCTAAPTVRRRMRHNRQGAAPCGASTFCLRAPRTLLREVHCESVARCLRRVVWWGRTGSGTACRRSTRRRGRGAGASACLRRTGVSTASTPSKRLSSAASVWRAPARTDALVSGSAMHAPLALHPRNTATPSATRSPVADDSPSNSFVLRALPTARLCASRAGWAQSRCRCGRGGLSPGADVARVRTDGAIACARLRAADFDVLRGRACARTQLRKASSVP